MRLESEGTHNFYQRLSHSSTLSDHHIQIEQIFLLVSEVRNAKLFYDSNQKWMKITFRLKINLVILFKVTKLCLF